MIDSVRHRPLALLAAVVLAQVLLLAFQIKRESGEHRVRLIRYWAVEMLTPMERAGTWTFAKIGGAWRGYFALKDARAENEKLRGEIERLLLRNRQLESQAAAGQRLAALQSFREQHPEAAMLPAEVIGASADPTSHTLFINRGEHDRVRRNLGVITPDGVVGKIVEVFPSSSQVLLINDKDSGVGALFAGTRTHGVVKGSGDPDPHMDYVVNDEKAAVGDAIVTSGEDRIFPKDLPIGAVASADPGNPFQVIRVRPAARLDRLENVLVLLSQQELAPKKTEAASAAPVATPSTPPAHTAPAPAAAAVTPPKLAPSAAKPAPASSEHAPAQTPAAAQSAAASPNATPKPDAPPPPPRR